jgi:sugar/nucleoside kinase (ribokinase family)
MTLSSAEISVDDFRGCRHAHIEGYLVFNRALADAVLAAARAAGCTVSLDLASFEVAAASRDWLFAQFKDGIDVVFANEEEIRALYQSDESYDILARRLAGEGVVAAVKVGKDGAWIGAKDALHRVVPVTVSDAIDTNGAGDSWAAGFLSGYIRGWPLEVCGRIASHLGAETVRHPGPIIPDAHFRPLVEKLAGFAP